MNEGVDYEIQGKRFVSGWIWFIRTDWYSRRMAMRSK